MRLETPLYKGQAAGYSGWDESTLKLDRGLTIVTVLCTCTRNCIESKSHSIFLHQQHETILVQVTYMYVLYRRQVIQRASVHKHEFCYIT